jgi:putative ABC transport system permease protein
VLAAQSLRSLVYGISLHDPVSFIAAPIALATLMLAASVAPALRAVRISPVSTLRG